MTEIIKDWLIIAGLALGVIIQLHTAINMRRLEKNTNSIQEALNKSNREAGELTGEKRGRADEIARQTEARL